MPDEDTTIATEGSLTVSETSPAVESTPPPTVIDASRPQWLDRGQIPGLDGLRTVAVLLVLMTHAHQTVGFPNWPIAKKLFHEGAIGVDIFLF